MPEILKDEKLLQIKELRGKIMAIIFDATLRQGDFFTMIGRIFVLSGKRAETRQVLFHCGVLTGSLNSQTLVGKLTTGLVNRNKVFVEFIAQSMNGCYINSAAHEILDTASDDVDLDKALTALCISQCTNNSGEKAKLTQRWRRRVKRHWKRR